MTVYSVVEGSNADLIRHVAELYADADSQIADVTYGRGVFWRKCPHLQVDGSDIVTRPDAAYDFRDLPYADESYDIVVLDPPYIHSPGNHTTDHRYQNAATTKGMLHRDIRELYRDGMREAMRVVRSDGGQVWVKCKDQVQSGMQRWAHVEMMSDALKLGLIPRDLFILIPHARTPQGRWKVQHHARKVHSYLWVFERPRLKVLSQIRREHLFDVLK